MDVLWLKEHGLTWQLCSFSNPIAANVKRWSIEKRSRLELTLLWLLIDTRLHCVLVVHSSKSTMPDWIPWWDPWNASQLMTDVPPEPLPASRAHTSKPVVETDFTHSAAGSWILTYVLPWLREANTLTSLEPWNWVLKETDWQPWLFWDVSVMFTFPAWNAIASEGNVRNKVNTEIYCIRIYTVLRSKSCPQTGCFVHPSTRSP